VNKARDYISGRLRGGGGCVYPVYSSSDEVLAAVRAEPDVVRQRPRRRRGQHVAQRARGRDGHVRRRPLGADRPLAYLSGPSFAAEIVNGIVTAVTIASYDRNLAIDVCTLLSSTNFRALYTPDVIGVEVGGAIKNVIAIAAGLCEGLGLGTNAMAALVTRGCSEMRRVVVMMGGEPSTVFGLSGVGDTFGTCFGPLSRNRQVGIRLGQGENIDDILAGTTEVAEGVATSRALKRLLDKKVRDRRGRLDATWPGRTRSLLTPSPAHPLRFCR